MADTDPKALDERLIRLHQRLDAADKKIEALEGTSQDHTSDITTLQSQVTTLEAFHA